MPTATFNNLNSEKRKRLIDAATIEFITNKFEKVSINKIIAKAKISRGSFYQYFQDKEDLYIYLLEQFHVKRVTKCYEKIAKANEDIFDLLRESLYEELEFLANGNNDKVTKKFLVNLNFSSYEKSLQNNIRKRIIENKEALKLFNKDKYNLKSKDEIVLISQMIISSSLMTISLYNEGIISKIEAGEQMDKMLNIIRRGSLK